MSELLSVGLDVGTTTTQLILSRLKIENKASSFTVPELQIADREILYRSNVHFTPLQSQQLVDGDAIRALVEREYAAAGITRHQVDTGAVIITGETSRKENAARVLAALSEFAGDFVVATAGPHLESVLAAQGAGAVELSAQEPGQVLHLDIGGGTANLALLQEGKILQTGCMNVGGRLLKFSDGGKVTYVSPVLSGLTDLQPGDYPQPCQVEAIARILTQGLEMAAGLRPATALLEKLWTKEAGSLWEVPQKVKVCSFSGGVADCIATQHPPLAFGDMGPQLGQAIRQSALCAGRFVTGRETIRATVIGAGCYSTTLSGSTVFLQNAPLPQKNLPVIAFTRQEQDSHRLSELIAQRLAVEDSQRVVLAFPGWDAPTYDHITALAQKILAAADPRELYICLEADMAKALGQYLRLLLPDGATCLCIDRVRLQPNSYLDLGTPVGPALPVVVKTLIME